MIDVHIHILPGIDDGSKSGEMSVAMKKSRKISRFYGLNR